MPATDTLLNFFAHFHILSNFQAHFHILYEHFSYLFRFWYTLLWSYFLSFVYSFPYLSAFDILSYTFSSLGSFLSAYVTLPYTFWALSKRFTGFGICWHTLSYFLTHFVILYQLLIHFLAHSQIWDSSCTFSTIGKYR